MEKTTSQVLQEARALVAAGWVKGMESSKNDDGVSYCIRGAVRTAALLDSEVRLSPLGSRGTPASLEAMRVLNRKLPARFENVVEFNDNPLTTRRQVLALFDRALTEVTK